MSDHDQDIALRPERATELVTPLFQLHLLSLDAIAGKLGGQ
jgi:hypothetical protein